jgi:uncharacterized protein (DUF934 family)
MTTRATLIPHLGRLALIEVATFPNFATDAAILQRESCAKLAYTGELRAQGDVLVDQIPLMKRCGFDSLRAGSPPESGGG